MDEPDGYAIVPSMVRLSPGELLQLSADEECGDDGDERGHL
jgi:hypothetical protein